MPTQPKYASEFYFVEETIDVVVTLKATKESARIRLEALKETSGKYSVKSYIEEHFTLQPTYPKEHGKNPTPPRDVLVWVDYALPWVDRDSADAALTQALGFLRERCVEPTA
jgi:hypothetical protein